MMPTSIVVTCPSILLLLFSFVRSGTSFQSSVSPIQLHSIPKSRIAKNPNDGYSIETKKILSSISKQNTRLHDDKSKTKLSAMPFFQWFLKKEDPSEGDLNELTIRELNSISSKNDNQQGLDTMQRTAKMMQNHRRSQEASERTMAIMEELSSTLVVGKSKAGAGSTGGIAGIAGLASGDQRKGGVQVTFDGQRRPVSVAVDPNFLFSTSSSTGESEGVISIEDLNAAITDAMLHGYELSGKVMEEKMTGLYEQLGLPKDPPSLSNK